MVLSTLYVKDAGLSHQGAVLHLQQEPRHVFGGVLLLDSALLPSLPLPFSFCLHVCLLCSKVCLSKLRCSELVCIFHVHMYCTADPLLTRLV